MIRLGVHSSSIRGRSVCRAHLPGFTVVFCVLLFSLGGPAFVGAEEADDEEVEDADLDEQTYEEDDDDFVPTEEIPADEPIPFPTDI